MSEVQFQVGDEVEVLPQTVGELDWRREMVARYQGSVRVIDPWSPLSVGVQFPGLTSGHDLGGLLSGGTMEGWWCAPGWLRLLHPPHPQQLGRPLFQMGDLVDMGDFSTGLLGRITGGKVIDVDAEPRYSVQWPDGHVQRIKESTLRRHVVAPVVCAPDGTRCEWMRANNWGDLSGDASYCSRCGGKLRGTPADCTTQGVPRYIIGGGSLVQDAE